MDQRAEKDIGIFKEKGIVFHSIKNELYEKQEGDKVVIKKKPTNMPNYKDIVLEKKYNRKLNGTIIPLGESYDLIGVDVDNKGDTLEKFDVIRKDNKAKSTLTLETVNGGYHYYYRLRKHQREGLKDFRSKNDAIFGLKIDIKYNNQIFFGPSIFNFKGKKYRYRIVDDSDPIYLPTFIYNELLKNISVKKEVKEVKQVKKEVKQEVKQVEKDMSDLIKFLDCLDVKRFDEYESWLKIGAIIFNEGGSYELFDRYSKLSKKYDKNGCIEKWNEYKKHKGTKLKIGTIVKWAVEDNPEKCKEHFKNDINPKIRSAIKSYWDDDSLCEIFYMSNPNNIMYDEDIKKWYILNHYNIWQIETDLELINMISGTLPNLLKKQYIKIISEDVFDDDIHKKFGKLMKYCGSIKTQTNLVNRLKSMYKKEKLQEKMDSVNDYLFAFKNGVYDLQNFVFRLPEPKEYISRTCDYKYVPVEKVNEKKIEWIHNIIYNMFENDEIKDYVLTTIAQCLCGVLTNEEFYIWRGQGRNGKGVLRDLIKITFSVYFDAMEIDNLDKTKSGSSSAADLNMAEKRYARIVFTTEPDSAMQLKTNKIAQWTGGDPVQCRFLYKGLFTYVPKWKLFIQSNYDLLFPGKNIKAFTERTNLVRFPYSFVSDKVTEYERQIDPTIKEKLKDKDYKIAFFHILLKYYKQYVENCKKISKPQNVKEETEMLFITADPFSEFYKAAIKKIDDTSKYIKSSDLYKSFKLYNQKHDMENIKLNQSEFKACLIEKGLRPSILSGCVVWRNIMYTDNFISEMNKTDSMDLLV